MKQVNFFLISQFRLQINTGQKNLLNRWIVWAFTMILTLDHLCILAVLLQEGSEFVICNINFEEAQHIGWFRVPPLWSVFSKMVKYWSHCSRGEYIAACLDIYSTLHCSGYHFYQKQPQTSWKPAQARRWSFSTRRAGDALAAYARGSPDLEKQVK